MDKGQIHICIKMFSMIISKTILKQNYSNTFMKDLSIENAFEK